MHKGNQAFLTVKISISNMLCYLTNKFYPNLHLQSPDETLK